MTSNDQSLPFPLRGVLEASGIAYKLHSHKPLLTVQDIEAELTFPREQWVKALAFKIKGDGWVLAAMQAHSRLDYRKLAEALGVTRGQLERPSTEELQHEMGFEPGGVAPIPPSEDVKAVYDSAV